MPSTTSRTTATPAERLEEALAHLHEMEPEDAALVISRTLESMYAQLLADQ